jgi:peptidyl-prolyl cis-trans isomerase A (cyclophilin A)
MPIMIRNRSPFIALAAALLAATACAPAAVQAPPAAAVPATLAERLNPASPALNLAPPDSFRVFFETTQGDFVVQVVTAQAPLGAARVYNLVRAGYYDGVRFFRVVPGFVVQFGIHGDPTVPPLWREARIADDTVRARNVRGTVTFAMAGPDTRTVQLFINLADNSRLDAQGFAPIGHVRGGMDVVDRLYAGYGEGAPRGSGPLQNRIQEEGDAYLAAEFPLLDRIIRAWILDR